MQMTQRIIKTAKEDLLVPALIEERERESNGDVRSQETRICPSEVCECSQDSQPTTEGRSVGGTQGHELVQELGLQDLVILFDQTRIIHSITRNIQNL